MAQRSHERESALRQVEQLGDFEEGNEARKFSVWVLTAQHQSSSVQRTQRRNDYLIGVLLLTAHQFYIESPNLKERLVQTAPFLTAAARRGMKNMTVVTPRDNKTCDRKAAYVHEPGPTRELAEASTCIQKSHPRYSYQRFEQGTLTRSKCSHRNNGPESRRE